MPLKREFCPNLKQEEGPVFHDDDPWLFWFNASCTVIRFSSALMPSLVKAGLFLPILLRFSSRFPLAKKVSLGIKVLPQLILASLVVFVAAHALVFQLHFPSRHTQHSLRIVMVLVASMALTLLLDAILQWLDINHLETVLVKTSRGAGAHGCREKN